MKSTAKDALLSDQIAEMLIKALYSGFTNCGPPRTQGGPSRATLAYFPRVVPDVSSYVKDVPYIVPDVCYHPEIYVTIDFTYQFTLSSTKIKGKRPVDPNVLKNTTKRLLKFFNYYIRYAYSYAKKGDDAILSEVDFITQQAEAGDEDAQSLFLNNVVNFFFTNFSVSRGRGQIGSATITLKDNPNYRMGRRENIFFESLAPILNQIFVPMLPVMLWARGRIYKDWFFPIFDGYLMRAAPADASGFTSVDLSCLDSLELARVSQEMINPAIIQVEEFREQSSINIYSKPLYGNDHLEIFDRMFHGGKLIYNADSKRFVSESEVQTNSANAGKQDGLDFARLGDYGRATDAWAETGYGPESVADTRAVHNTEFNIERALFKTKHSNRKRMTVSWGSHITPYRLFNTRTPQTYTSDFSSRLDVLREIAGMVYYDLYVDGWGNVQYHPMRFANYFLQHDIRYISKSGVSVEHENIFPGTQVIGPHERVTSSKSLNMEEMVTFLRLQGSPVVSSDDPTLQVFLMGSYTDMHLMRRFGYRRESVSNTLFNENPDVACSDGTTRKFMNMAAEAVLKYANAGLYTMEENIIFRPELEVALPLYIQDSREVFYVDSINHSGTIGGDATTTISASFGRKEKDPAPDLFNYIIASQQIYKLSGQTVVSEGSTENRLDVGPLPPEAGFPKGTDAALALYEDASAEVDLGLDISAGSTEPDGSSILTDEALEEQRQAKESSEKQRATADAISTAKRG